tara:strand:+ start:138 stop:797 length:660 start_codon:yes stop_codon:yes gene_type:complete
LIDKLAKDKVKDMSMTDDEWNRPTGRITEWMTPAKIKEIKAAFKDDAEALEDATQGIALIKSQIKRGNNNSKNRVKYYDVIKTEGRAFLSFGWPIQRGQQSKLPEHMQESLNEMCDAAHPVFVELWNNNPIIQVTSLISDRNKTSGGSTYADAESFAKAKVLALRQRFVKHGTAQKDKDGVEHEARWDGNFDIGGMTIAPPFVAETDDAQEEVSEGDSA